LGTISGRGKARSVCLARDEQEVRAGIRGVGPRPMRVWIGWGRE